METNNYKSSFSYTMAITYFRHSSIVDHIMPDTIYYFKMKHSLLLKFNTLWTTVYIFALKNNSNEELFFCLYTDTHGSVTIWSTLDELQEVVNNAAVLQNVQYVIIVITPRHVASSCFVEVQYYKKNKEEKLSALQYV